MGKRQGMIPEKGEVWLADLTKNEQKYGQQGYRPVMIFTPLRRNKSAHMVTVVPITSKSKRHLACHVIAPTGNNINGTLLTEQITTIDVSALIKPITKLEPKYIKRVDLATLAQLGMINKPEKYTFEYINSQYED